MINDVRISDGIKKDFTKYYNEKYKTPLIEPNVFKIIKKI